VRLSTTLTGIFGKTLAIGSRINYQRGLMQFLI